jgi:acyl-CoA dehydrogenase
MLAQLVEELAAAEAATQLAFASDGFDEPRTAIAKIRCGMAAANVAALAHQIHGAIGMTDEYPLSRYTRALADWRNASGGESIWATRLARLVLKSNSPTLAAWLAELN